MPLLHFTFHCSQAGPAPSLPKFPWLLLQRKHLVHCQEQKLGAVGIRSSLTCW